MRPTYWVDVGFEVGTRVFVMGRSLMGRAVLGGAGDDGISWTRIGGVEEIHTFRGRIDELSRVDTGWATLVVNNESGDFSPENTGGAYYPNVKPYRRVRAGSTFNGTDYSLFYGLGRFRPSLDSGDPTVTIDCKDLFLQLARDELNQVTSEQLTGARLQAILNTVALPSSLWDLDAGKSTLPTATLSAASKLQHLLDVCEVEDGLAWVGGNGQVRFRDRHARITRAESITSQATFGGASGLPFLPGEYDDGADSTYNELRITRTGGTEQVEVDETSKNDYGTNVYRLSSEHFLDDAQADNFAKWKRGQLRNPVPRLKSIILRGGGDDDLWVQMLVREISDRVTIVRNFPGNLGINHDYFVESVRHDITNGLNDHAVTWSLSKCDIAGPWFVMGRSLMGRARLGW